MTNPVSMEGGRARRRRILGLVLFVPALGLSWRCGSDEPQANANVPTPLESAAGEEPALAPADYDRIEEMNRRIAAEQGVVGRRRLEADDEAWSAERRSRIDAVARNIAGEQAAVGRRRLEADDAEQRDRLGCAPAPAPAFEC